MELGLFGEVNLFADQDEENENYINALDAIELIGHKTGNHTPDVCRFLMLKGFNYSTQTYRKDYLGRILANDSRIEDIPFEDWSITSDILKKGLENFKYSGNRYSDNYEKADYEDYYWLRSDFFSFQPIQELNISPSDYTDYLTGKALLWLSKQEKDTFIEDMQELDKDELKPKTFEPPLFYLNDTFSLIEASCLLSGDSPIQINRCFNDTNFDQNHHNFNEAYNFINSAIWAGSLPENLIPSHQLKLYLQSKGKIIEGFNDNLPIQEPIGCGNPTIQQTEPNIESLNAEISRLRKEIEDKNKTVVELQNRINELEADQPIEQSENNHIDELTGLSRINQLAQDRQAMARTMAVYLWEQEKHKDKLPKDIALLVMKEMRNYCADGDIPQTTEAMKRIISSVTPEHAKNKRKIRINYK